MATTGTTSEPEVEEAVIEEVAAVVVAREAEAAGAAAVETCAFAAASALMRTADVWMQNESLEVEAISPATEVAVSLVAVAAPAVAISPVAVAIAAAAAAAKWRGKERRLRQARLQTFLERPAQLVEMAGGSCVHACMCMTTRTRACVRACTHAGSGMSALRRGEHMAARLLEDSASRRPHSARIDTVV